ncbi:hypothetical protein BH11PAT4_BH11PAT4_2270 [soil metagenome]
MTSRELPLTSAGYYRSLLIEAESHIEHLRGYGHPVILLSHPISASTPAQEIQNLQRLAATCDMLNINGLTPFDQIRFHASLNPDDPRNFPEKFDIFYRGLVHRTDFLLMAPGYEDSRGCLDELSYAREKGKPVYRLLPAFTEEFMGEFEPEEVPLGTEYRFLAQLSDSRIRQHVLKQTYGLGRGRAWEPFVEAL